MPLPIHLREWRKNWYSHVGHRARRAAQLRAHPLCVLCLERGVTTPATIADHVESHGGDWTSFRLGRLQSLCKACHDGEKQRLGVNGYSDDIGDDGWPLDPRHPANAQR